MNEISNFKKKLCRPHYFLSCVTLRLGFPIFDTIFPDIMHANSQSFTLLCIQIEFEYAVTYTKRHRFNPIRPWVEELEGGGSSAHQGGWRHIS